MKKKQKNIFEEFDGLEVKYSKDFCKVIDGKRIYKGDAAAVERFLREKGVIRKK